MTAPADPRKAPCRCGSGRAYKRCCYPRDRALDGARRAAAEGRRGVDEVLRVFLPLVESRGEHRLACKDGCDDCCSNFVHAGVPEALLIADWLATPENAPVLERFRARLPAWRAAGGEALIALERLLVRHGGPPMEGSDADAYRRRGVEYGQKLSPCPFLDEHRCAIYPVRPNVCRAVWVVGSNEHCVPGRGVPKRVSHPALEEAVHEAGRNMAAEAARLDEPERSLPEAVARALALTDR